MRIWCISLIFAIFFCAPFFCSAEVVTIKLKTLMCYETTAEITDEISISIGSVELGPYNLRDGNSVLLNYVYENPENNRVGVIVDENDYDDKDLLGITHIFPEAIGEFTWDIRDESGKKYPHYTLTYEVYEQAPVVTENYYLFIRSVKCNDAQEAEDEVFINVNNELLWISGGLKSGKTKEQQSDTMLVPAHIIMELWEQDGSSSDLIETEEFYINDDMLRRTQSLLFYRNKGIVGDAKYTVYYYIYKE